MQTIGQQAQDLIDTLWNVKVEALTNEAELQDLIDTLWNVKRKVGGLEFNLFVGFNRYIVECKAGQNRRLNRRF